MSLRCKSGFTLAEVLITLAVIGIVASMSIPSLMNDVGDREVVSKLKKAYAVISSATGMINAECSGRVTNCMDYGSTGDNNFHAVTELYDLYKEKLNVTKHCRHTGSGCFNSAGTYKLSGGDWINISTYVNIPTMLTNDGMAYAFDWNGESNTASVYAIFVDVNGVSGEGKLGRDIFIFCYNSDKDMLEPAGLNYYVGDCDDPSVVEGKGCTERVLREDAITY